MKMNTVANRVHLTIFNIITLLITLYIVSIIVAGDMGYRAILDVDHAKLIHVTTHAAITTDNDIESDSDELYYIYVGGTVLIRKSV